jgi:hypothetical protein
LSRKLHCSSNSWCLSQEQLRLCCLLGTTAAGTRLQIFLLFGIVLAFFLLTTSLSPYVNLGLYDRYLKQHGGVFTLCLLSVLLVGSIGAYRLVRLQLQQ